MKCVIFAGGYGTRISEESQLVPKPLIQIGGIPILVHIMQHYAKFGVKEFIILAGYKAIEIKKFFLNYALYTSDIEVELRSNTIHLTNNKIPDWNIKVIDTGLNTMTGGRLLKVRNLLLKEKHFFLTYGDGVSNVNLELLLDFHKEKSSTLTLTAVKSTSRFGVLKIDGGVVEEFREKSNIDGDLINAGFFVSTPKIFDYLEGDNCIFENEPMRLLTKEKQLSAYHHTGFWHPMDTLRDKNYLEELYNSGNSPWS